MTQVSSGFETGVHGATVAITDLGDPTAWDAVQIGAGNSIVYDNTLKHTGNLAALFTRTTGTVYLQWSTALGTVTDSFEQVYVYFHSLPTNTNTFLQLLSGASNACNVRIDATGKLTIRDSTGTNLITSTVTIPVDQWVRLDWHVIHSTTTGFAELKIFLNADSSTPSETIASPATANTLASANTFRVLADHGGQFRLDNPTAGAVGAYITPKLPVNVTAPAISGTATVGNILTCSTGTWQAVDSAIYSYQWQRDVAGNGVFSNISGATSSTYTLVAADGGNRVRCVVTAINGGGSTPANTSPTALVSIPAPVNTVAPTISGTPQVEETLTCNPGTWLNSPTLTYQWQRDSGGNGAFVNISGATASTYLLVTADGGNAVRCRVTGTNAGGSATGNSGKLPIVPAPGSVPPEIPPEPYVEIFTDVERFIIAESPATLWPENQDSIFGYLRHAISVPMQDAVDILGVLWTEMFLNTAVDLLGRWEKQLGLPVAPAGWSIQKRRWVAKGRAERRPFTIQRRVDLVWYFIAETLGSPIELRDNGVPLTNDGLELRNEMALDPYGFDVGVPLYNTGVEMTDAGIPLSGQSIFTIIEDISNFSYEVRILNTYALDPALEREIQWMTPAGITATVSYVPVL